MMKNNVNIFGNVQWNIIFFFVQHLQQKLNKVQNQILHELVQDFDLGRKRKFFLNKHFLKLVDELNVKQQH
jgi:hypothetical protein